MHCATRVASACRRRSGLNLSAGVFVPLNQLISIKATTRARMQSARMLPRALFTSFIVLIAFADIPFTGRPADPFGSATFDVPAGPIVEIWQTVREQFLEDRALVKSCRYEKSTDCDAVFRLLKIVREASEYRDKAVLAHINRSINLLLKPVPSNWASALDSVKLGSGDCKAFSAAKYLALREAGIFTDNIRLVIVRNRPRDEDHMVVAVYQSYEWLILDDQTMSLLPDGKEQNYTPIFVLDNAGVRRYGTPVPVG